MAFQERPAKDGDKDVTRTRVVRKLYIMPKDYTAFGYTVGCSRCDNDRRYGLRTSSKSHSNACHERIRSELAKTPEGQRRIAAAEDRLNRSIAEQIEVQDLASIGHGGELRICPMVQI